jgi:tetratricopeptide (TPR) repeat protein
VAQPKRRVFVSFSGHDRPMLRRLLARLADHALDVWDYSREDAEIPGGAELVEELLREVNRCDVFIPVLTQHSFRNEFVRREVERAIALRAEASSPAIIPLLVADAAAPSMPDPFGALSRYRIRRFRPEGGVEPIVAELCRDLALDYRPMLPEDRRFPLLARFQSEIGNTAPLAGDRDNAVYVRLHTAIGSFREAFDAAQFTRASDVMAYVIGICEYEFAGDTFYYPYLVRAVCALLQGRLLEASAVLEKLSDHPRSDEHYLALQGMLSFQRGAYHEAQSWFERAAKAAADRGADDLSPLAWLLQTHLHTGAPIQLGGLIQRLDEAEGADTTERLNVRKLAAFAEARLGSQARAAERLRALVNDGHATADVLTSLAGVLDELGEARAARELLQSHLHGNADQPLYRQALGSLCYRTGRAEEALAHFRALVEREPAVRQFYYDAMLVAHSLGHDGEARDLASRILDRKTFPLPATPDDYFIDGLANFLLGRHERARYDRERSGSSKDYYALLSGRVSS